MSRKKKQKIPHDLEVALAANAAAMHFFQTLDRANRYAIIYCVNGAKLQQTRPSELLNTLKCCLAARHCILGRMLGHPVERFD